MNSGIRILKIIFGSICLMVWGDHCYAQFQTDIKGAPVKEGIYTEMDGNPYLEYEWNGGSVMLKDSTSFIATLKFDIFGNHILFQNNNGKAMELKNDAIGFSLNVSDNTVSDLSPLIFVSGYPRFGPRTEKSWYQLIAGGKVRLLKFYKKTIREDWEFTSSTVTKTFQSFKFYYIFKNNHLIPVQPTKSSILEALKDHAAEAENYIKANHIKFGKDTQLKKLFEWYNSLI